MNLPENGPIFLNMNGIKTKIYYDKSKKELISTASNAHIRISIERNMIVLQQIETKNDPLKIIDYFSHKENLIPPFVVIEKFQISGVEAMILNNSFIDEPRIKKIMFNQVKFVNGGIDGFELKYYKNINEMIFIDCNLREAEVEYLRRKEIESGIRITIQYEKF